MSYSLRILLLAASLLTLFYILKRIRKAQIQLQDSLFWIFLSILFVLMGAFPQLVYKLTRALHFQAPVNLIYSFIIFLLLIKVFLSSIKISQLESKLDNLVQEIGIAETLRNEKEIKTQTDSKDKKDTEA